MSPLTIVLSIAFVCLFLINYFRQYKKKRPHKEDTSSVRCTVPKGPRGHWLFGHTLLPSEQLAPVVASWSATHGPIFEVFMVPKIFPLAIIVNDVKLVKGKLEGSED